MTTSKLLVRATTGPDPSGWRAGTVRVLANALLVLLVYEAVFMVGLTAQMIVTGWTPPETPVEGMPFLLYAAVFCPIRGIYVLPGVLAVLVGIEYVARRVPHARVLTAIVAFAPMVWWELTQSTGDFPSTTGVVFSAIAVLFALLARLPARFQGRATEDRGAARPPAGTAVAPR